MSDPEKKAEPTESEKIKRCIVTLANCTMQIGGLLLAPESQVEKAARAQNLAAHLERLQADVQQIASLKKKVPGIVVAR